MQSFSLYGSSELQYGLSVYWTIWGRPEWVCIQCRPSRTELQLNEHESWVSCRLFWTHIFFYVYNIYKPYVCLHTHLIKLLNTPTIFLIGLIVFIQNLSFHIFKNQIIRLPKATQKYVNQFLKYLIENFYWNP